MSQSVFFLTEAQKANAEAVFDDRGLGWLHGLMLAGHPSAQFPTPTH